jgi:glutaredoxin
MSYTIYGPTNDCRFTTRARKLLDERHIAYEFVPIDTIEAKNKLYTDIIPWKRTGEFSKNEEPHRTVPVVVSPDNLFIGGMTELSERLDKISRSTGRYPISIPVSYLKQSTNASEISVSHVWLKMVNLFKSLSSEEAIKYISFNLFSENKYKCLAISGNLSPLCSEPVALGRQGKAGFVSGMICDSNEYIIKREEVSLYVKIYRPKKYVGPNDPAKIKPVERWIGLPEYVNEVIIGFLLNSIGFGTPQVNAFMCQGDSRGYIVQKRAECGDFASFLASSSCTVSIASDLILNILAQLHYLETNFNFIHGDMKPQNILIFADGAGGFSAKLTDFGKSAITWDGNRIFHRLIRTHGLAVSTLTLPTKVKSDGTYMVESAAWITGVNTRHRRFIYHLNYDMYTFMTLISLTDIGKKAIDANIYLQSVWSGMWTNVAEVEKRLLAVKASQTINLNSITTAYKILRGLTLRSSLINFSD